MKVLVVGGAGYIGSFTVHALQRADFSPVIFDSLETGHRKSVPKVKIYRGNLQVNDGLLDKVFREEKPEAVIQFAAYIEAGESVQNPQKYFYNNVYGSLNLFKAMLKHKVNRLVFSSTAAVYGEPKNIPISEDDPKKPTNPYGESKLMIENILSWYAKACSLNTIALRYFNAAGADLKGEIGQDYPKPTHLITRACEAFLGRRDDFAIFGDDYPTPDGTCIRDYIHVLDLAQAHVAALKHMTDKTGYRYYNIGTGKGYSVNEVVKVVKKISGVNLKIPVAPRRPGDPARLIAKAEKIKKELNWRAKHSDLKTIVKSAWLWHKNHPNGFKS